MTQTVWIARHGNRIDFVNPAWFNTAERRYDPHLSPDGEVQAQQLAKRLMGEGIRQIFASPFLRTVQTANFVAEALNLPLKLDWGLCEWFNVDWMNAQPETLPLDVLAQQFPRIDPTYPIGAIPAYPETWEACLQRTGETVQRLVRDFPQDNLLLVGHGVSVRGVAMGLVPTLQETEIRASLCSIVKIVRSQTKWVIRLNGDTSHLSQTEAVVRLN